MRCTQEEKSTVHKAVSSQTPKVPSGSAQDVKKAVKDSILSWKMFESSFLFDPLHIQEVRSL